MQILIETDENYSIIFCQAMSEMEILRRFDKCTMSRKERRDETEIFYF